MKLHDIQPQVPDWVQTVARAWHRSYGLRHMPLVYDAATGRLGYTQEITQTVRWDVTRSVWRDWERYTLSPNFDPNWVTVV